MWWIVIQKLCVKNNDVHYYNAFQSYKFTVVMVHALFYLALFNQKSQSIMLRYVL